MHLRYYFPEKPAFRWYRQKQDCNQLALPVTVRMERAAPVSKALQKARIEAAEHNKPAPLANARAHRFLDQVEAVHKALKWLTVAPPPPATVAAPSPATASIPQEKPGKLLEAFDLQDLPLAMDALGFKLGAALLRKWFSNPAYSVRSQAQKECAYGAPFYPPNQVDSVSLRHSELIERDDLKQAYEKIKSTEFLESKAVRDALYKILCKTPLGVVDIDADLEFAGDLQKQHRKYAFASVLVGKQFAGRYEDIRVDALDKSASACDDIEWSLGELRWYAAIRRAHVFYNGRTTRRIQVQSIAFYAMAPYGFDGFEATLEFKGHWNKKHLALVTDGSWLNVPVYIGHDVYAKNAVLYPLFHEHFRRWRDIHQQGGDMLLFSERMTPYSVPLLDVVVPLHKAVSPQAAAQEVLRALQHSNFAKDYKGTYQFVLQDFGEYATAGTKVIDRIDGTIRLNSQLFAEVTAENIDLFAGAVAHETLHQNQNVLAHLRDSLPIGGQNVWHEELDDKALADTSAVMNQIKNALGL